MFEIAGLFQDDLSHSHLTAVRSLSGYLDNILGDELTPSGLFSMQKQVYEIQRLGAEALTRSTMHDRQFDCKMGCDSCCYATDVDITPAEAFYLADYIRRENKFHNGERFQIAPRPDKMAACSLLKDNVCSVYEARPLSCRYILSTDLASCLNRRETLTGGAKLPPPFSHFRSSITASCFVLFKKRGLDARWLVLDKSIEHIVNDENAIDNWLAAKPMGKSIKADEPVGKFNELILAVEAVG